MSRSQFPNGRWGNSSSPAFGDLDNLILSLPQKPQDAITLWGTPTSIGDVAELFAKFCKGELKSLPWSDQPAAKETGRIASQLAKINQLGFLTVCRNTLFSFSSSARELTRGQRRTDQLSTQCRWGEIRRSCTWLGTDQWLRLPKGGLKRDL